MRFDHKGVSPTRSRKLHLMIVYIHACWGKGARTETCQGHPRKTTKFDILNHTDWAASFVSRLNMEACVAERGSACKPGHSIRIRNTPMSSGICLYFSYSTNQLVN